MRFQQCRLLYRQRQHVRQAFAVAHRHDLQVVQERLDALFHNSPQPKTIFNLDIQYCNLYILINQ